MAALCRHAYANLSRLLYRGVQQTAPRLGHRTLFSNSILGLETFGRERIACLDRFRHWKGNMVKRIEGSLAEGKVVLREDIEVMMLLAETDQDVDLVVSMARRYIQSVDGSPTNLFHFLGPGLCKLLHYINKPEKALKFFKDESLTDSLFVHFSSHLVLMDLMYESGKYEEVVDILKHLQSVHKETFDYPKNHLMLLFAAFYKMNTAESLQETLKYLQLLKKEKPQILKDKILLFSALLAMNQNQHVTALEIVSNDDSERFANLNIKAICNAKEGCLQESLDFFEHSLRDDRPPYEMYFRVFPETVEAVEKAVEQQDSVEVKQRFNVLKRGLSFGGLIRSDSLSKFAEIPVFARNNFRGNFKHRQRRTVSNQLPHEERGFVTDR